MNSIRVAYPGAGARAITSINASWTGCRDYSFSVEAVSIKGYVKTSYLRMLADWKHLSSPRVRRKRQYNLFPVFQRQERLKSWCWIIVRSFVQEMSAFAVGIRTRQDVPPIGWDGLRTLQMADAIYRPSREKQVVEV